MDEANNGLDYKLEEVDEETYNVFKEKKEQPSNGVPGEWKYVVEVFVEAFLTITTVEDVISLVWKYRHTK